ncbi:ATP-binding protein [Alkalilimnicola ehrlichii]|uniref:ATP-binding protein n=1 Tax=Alkalilimnicola ehrlichii TaxID=351052 RepID=UPI000E2FE7AA
MRVSRVLNPPSLSAEQGAGVGLSFSKMVMQTLGGNIACRSVYGEYTEFTLTLPRVADVEQNG